MTSLESDDFDEYPERVQTDLYNANQRRNFIEFQSLINVGLKDFFEP
jgi:hypothetical protein